MKILAFDLSTRRGSIALVENEETLVAQDWPNDRRSSAPFFSVLDEIVRVHGRPQMIVVGLGPGSYTGTRIAVSAAMGLQMTTGAELFGLPSISAISTEPHYFVNGDAKRASFFWAEIQNGNLKGEPQLLSESEMRACLAGATAPIYTSDELPQFDRAKLKFPSAGLLSRLAKKSENLVRAPLTPIYLRAPHITTPRPAALK